MTLLNVKPGDVFLVRSRGYWYSNAIAWFMQSEWSHSGLVRFKCVGGENIALETSDYECTYGSLEKYAAQPEKYRLKVFRVPELGWDAVEQKRAMEKTDAEYYGHLYGYLQLLSFAVVRLLRRVNIRVGNFIRQGQVCTAIPLNFLAQSRHPEFRGLDPESLDTEDFAQLLEIAEAEVIYESGA